MNTPVLPTADIFKQTKAHILQQFNHKHHSGRVYHTYAQANAQLRSLETLLTANQLPAETATIAKLASQFAALSYLEDVHYATNQARHFLNKKQFDATEDVVQTIHRYKNNQIETSTDALLSDAEKSVQFGENYFDWSALRRLELDLLHDQRYSKQEWQQLELDRLMQVKYYTPYGKIHFAPILAQHIAKLKNRLNKYENTPQKTLATATFEQLELEKTARGAQTFFRANYRNHINLSAIADNKANIMISVNSILISVLITVLTWRNITETQPEVLMPGVIFLVTALASLICAVLSARPKVTNLNEQNPSFDHIKKNIAFFGNFVTLNLEQYEEAMDEVLRNDELLYGNMSRDLYYLGKVLSKKYYFLSISYNVFMIGFSVSVGLFLILLFLR